MVSILNELSSLPHFIREATARTKPIDLTRRPSEGVFSLVEQVCHLRDLEREGYLIRIQRILTEDRPLLNEIDGDKLASESEYQSQDVQAALNEFGESRARSIGLLRNASEDQLRRSARFGSFGLITLRQLVDMMLEHDRAHRAEIEQIVAEPGEALETTEPRQQADRLAAES